MLYSKIALVMASDPGAGGAVTLPSLAWRLTAQEDGDSRVHKSTTLPTPTLYRPFYTSSTARHTYQFPDATIAPIPHNPVYETFAEVKQRSLSHPQPKAEPREAQQGRSKTSARQASGTCIEGASSSVCCVSKADNANNAWSITEASQLFQHCLVQSRYLSYILLADTDFHLSSLSLRIRNT